MDIQKLFINQFLDNTTSLFSDDSKVSLIKGCYGSYDSILTANHFKANNDTILAVFPTTKESEIFQRELENLLSEDVISIFPSRDAIPYNMKSPFGPTVESRLNVLWDLMNDKRKIYITTAAALLQKVPTKKDLFNKTIRVEVNESIEIESLTKWLSENGFSRETMVTDPGTFAVRGGILDIYPFMTENPIRIEFFGDFIESVREFDIFRQRSIKDLNNFSIFPMKEFIISDEELSEGIEEIEYSLDELKADEVSFEKLKHTWESNPDHEGIEWFLHWFSLDNSSIFDYLPQSTTIIWNDIQKPQDRFEDVKGNYIRHIERVPESYRPFISHPDKLLLPKKEIRNKLQNFKSIFLNTDINEESNTSINLSIKDQPSFNGHLQLFNDELKNREDKGYSTYVICESRGQAERLIEQIDEIPSVTILYGFLKSGFIDDKNKVAVYWENGVFNRVTQKYRKIKTQKSAPITNFDALSPGDYVVHIDHGISKFLRVERVNTGKTVQDCMVLEFQNKSKVFVPVQDFSKVQKYIGKDSTQPTLSKLGSTRWEKTKEKTRESLKEMAQDLIELYAKRDALKGIAFQKDTIWQKEFEDSFIYEPTKDQVSAVKDIKSDMESSRPMDRLVCGDVGFGKTEVAMRACFKAAVEGFQVAVLAPTTILANQHFLTFKERMADFPISISVLSRFQKPSEQKKILEKTKSGHVNILIGTHRILSKDVEFGNLGLLVIDEEQRFGVKHKEKLKEYRYKVDVLSMSATPIPRTMHMSLAGIRDLSIINTPPNNRLPVETTVAEYHDEIVLNAIENEVERGGQVFIVHNRINNLYLMQENYERLIPEARIAVAHGQMDEKMLELIMKEFIAGKYDVLLSTTIIENGLDITNVNTIIVNRSDMLGLSQLYQLRGRVGRSSEQAFAYFLTPSFKSISDDSLKRLRALEQYTDLGSGFQIAMRDMEIRGAGNLLGTTQHGFIASIGFELYTQLLKEEVELLRNGKISDKQEFDINIQLSVDGFIPSEYISDDSSRVSIYQELSSSKSIKDIIEIEKELIDKYGPIPKELESLLITMQIRIEAVTLKITSLSINQDNKLILTFYGNDEETGQILREILPKIKNPIEIKGTSPAKLHIQLSSYKPTVRLHEIKSLIGHFSAVPLK